MSISIIITFPWAPELPGGGPIDCYQTARYLKAAGAEVILLPVASSGPNRFPRPRLNKSLVSQWQEHDLVDDSVKEIRVPQNSLHYLLDGLAVKKTVRRLLAQQRIDAVLGWQHEIAFLPQLLRSERVIFGMIASNGYYKEWYYGCNRFRRFLRDLTVVRPFRQADVVFARSNFMRNLVVDLFDLNQQRVKLAYCGVAPIFGKAIRNSDEDISRFFYYGSLIESKGIFDALEALGLIAAQGERKWTFKIAGWGKEDQVLQAAHRHGIEDRIVMLGHLNQSEIVHELEQSNLAILPSYFESFGLACAEAQATGLPVIAYDVGAVPEIVENNVTGWLVPKGHVNRLAEAIMAAMRDPQKTFQMGLSARERTNRAFSWSRTAETMLQNIEEIKRQKCGRNSSVGSVKGFATTPTHA